MFKQPTDVIEIIHNQTIYHHIRDTVRSYHQIRHFSSGFIPELAGQLKASENSRLLERGPRTLNLSGACSSFLTWWEACLSVWRAHQGRA